MTIVSISVNDRLLKEITSLQESLGFSGRSELVRAGLRMLVNDHREKSKLKGNIDAVIIVIHDDKESSEISALRHRYEEVIKTQVHNHLKNEKCIEIFMVSGAAEKIRALVDEFQTRKHVDFVKLIAS